MVRPPKISNLMSRISECLDAGHYRYLEHAEKRIQQRKVSRLEVKQVLRSGHHEKSKDVFREEYGNWCYSVKGRTVDKRVLRIAVTFDEKEMLIVTVIVLSK